MDLNRIIAVQNPSIQGTNVHVQAPQTEINLQFVNPSTSSEALQFNVYNSRHNVDVQAPQRKHILQFINPSTPIAAYQLKIFRLKA